MTDIPVTYIQLEGARLNLINAIEQNLTTMDRDFLVSFKEGEPKWDLLNIKGAEDLPAVKWKLLNVQKMGTTKKHADLDSLKRKLGL